LIIKRDLRADDDGNDDDVKGNGAVMNGEERSSHG
jgi:hypothetical protein